MSFDVLGASVFLSVFIEAFIFELLVQFMHGEKEHSNGLSSEYSDKKKNKLRYEFD